MGMITARLLSQLGKPETIGHIDSAALTRHHQHYI
jgi:hypothetical protein